MADKLITGVWLVYEGGENDPSAQVIVNVELEGNPGVWHELIREPHNCPFSHCAHPSALKNLTSCA
jgi:hypothetical protein